LPDHIIAVNERHLKRLVSEYVRYYHEDRTHLGLGKATPHRRTRSVTSGHIISLERLGGLHHRYDRAAEPKRLARKTLRSNSILNVDPGAVHRLLAESMVASAKIPGSIRISYSNIRGRESLCFLVRTTFWRTTTPLCYL
jgi:hypothetical protein